MLVGGVFGSFKNDEEFRLVMFALGPLYSESYKPDAALQNCLATVYRSKTHSEPGALHTSYTRMLIWRTDDLYSETEKYFDYREKLPGITAETLVVVGEKDWICTPGKRLLKLERTPLKRIIQINHAS